ncbi:MAG: hypothetical protein WCI04_07365 [archaeon]
MSETDLKQYIKILKRWFYAITSSAILMIGASFFVSWKSAIVNSEKITTIEKLQAEQQEDIDGKASVNMVLGIKADLKEQVTLGFKEQDEKLDVIIKLYSRK